MLNFAGKPKAQSMNGMHPTAAVATGSSEPRSLLGILNSVVLSPVNPSFILTWLEASLEHKKVFLRLAAPLWAKAGLL